MGAIAEGLATFAQPLIDQTDGSVDQVNKAFAIAQFCFNLALASDESRDEQLDELRSKFGMSDVEFDDFRRTVIVPMIRRHEGMFPLMHRQGPHFPFQSLPQADVQQQSASVDKPTVADRYAPCPCNSGKKYKFCCGVKRR